MKNIVFIVALCGLFVSFVLFTPKSDAWQWRDHANKSSEFALQVRTNIPNQRYWGWTNETIYPLRCGYVLFKTVDAGSITIKVDQIRRKLKRQVTGNVVTTNLFGDVETNYIPTVTNTIDEIGITNAFIAQGNYGPTATGVDVSDTLAEQNYLLPGDELLFDFLTTNDSVWIFMNFLR